MTPDEPSAPDARANRLPAPDWVVVDMSATLLHHGHVRLLRFAATLGPVRVALVTDDEIERWKHVVPELSFEERREVLEAVRYVTDVVPAPWLVTDDYLDGIGCKVLVHGDDNVNPVDRHEVVIVPRTTGVSSSDLRAGTRAQDHRAGGRHL